MRTPARRSAASKTVEKTPPVRGGQSPKTPGSSKRKHSEVEERTTPNTRASKEFSERTSQLDEENRSTSKQKGRLPCTCYFPARLVFFVVEKFQIWYCSIMGSLTCIRFQQCILCCGVVGKYQIWCCNSMGSLTCIQFFC